MLKPDCSGGSAVGNVKIRYLVERQRTRRPTRYYWMPTKKLQDAGFLPRRLSDNKSEAIAQAEEHNLRLDHWYQGIEPQIARQATDTLAALDDLFQRDESFRLLKERSQRDYLYAIRYALAWAGDERPADLTIRVLKAWYRDQCDTRGLANARNAIAALRRLLSFAREEGWITENPALRLRVKSPPSRARVWTMAERDAFCRAALAAKRPSMALAVMVGWCLGQRPADLRVLAWTAYDGQTIALRQAKTDQAVRIPVLPELKALLDGVQRVSTQIVVSENTGRPYQESDFQHTFAEIRAGAELPRDLQFRDLRRTMATALGSAGCTDDQIRAITGHKTRAVVAVYVRPDDTFAKGAMDQLQKAKRHTS